MSSIHRLVAAVATAGAIAAIGVPGASADATPAPTICDGTLANQVVRDVFVPYDANCTLSNVIVRGSLTTEIDAGVVKLQGSVVTGDVTTLSHRLELRTTAVGGNLSVGEARDGVVLTRAAVSGNTKVTNAATELTIGDPSNASRGNVLGGDLVVDGAHDAGLVAYNAVGGDLLVRNGTAAVEVRRNAVRGTLGCSDNSPAPTGGANLAGAKLGQCAAL